MATTAAQLEVVVSANTSAAEKNLKAVSGESESAAKGLSGVGKGGKEAGAGATEGAGGLKGFLGNMLGLAGGITVAELAQKGLEFVWEQTKECITAGEEFQQTQALTVQALRSTHDASGMSAQGIDDLAESLSKVTPFSAEVTQQAENMLLRFTHIGKDVFPQTTATALDMAQALGLNSTQAARMLGRALDDPAKGMSALTRVGVTFSAAQQKVIKHLEATGHLSQAQSMILDALKVKFGGAAEAAGGTFAGSLQIAQNQMEVAREKIGSAFLPALAGIAAAIAPLVAGLANRLPGAIDFLQTHFDQIKPYIAGLAIVLAGVLLPALISLLVPLAAAALSAVAMAAPFILLGLAIGGVIVFFKHLYDTSAPFKAAINGIMGSLKPLVSVIRDQFQAGLALLMPYLKEAQQWIGGKLQDAAKAITPVITQAAQTVSQFAAGLSTKLGPAIRNVFHFIQVALKVLGEIWKAVWPTLLVVIQTVWGVIQGIVKVAWSLISGIISIGLDVLGGNWKGAWNDMKSMFSGIWDGIKQILTSMLSGLVNIFLNGLKGILGALAHIPGPVGDMARGALSAINKLQAGSDAATSKMSATAAARTLEMRMRVIANFDKQRLSIIEQLKNTTDPVKKHALEMKLAMVTHAEDMEKQSVQHAQNMAHLFSRHTKTMKTQSTQHTRDMVSDILSSIGGAASNLGTAVHNGIVAPITTGITNLASLATSWGTNLIQNLINGIQNMAGKVKDAASNIANGIKNVLGFHSPAKEGPGSDADQWAPNLMAMFAQGLTDATPALSTAAALAMAGVKSALTSGALGSVGLSGMSGMSASGASGLVGPSSASQMARAITSAAATSAGAGGAGTPIILQLDGMQVGMALLPHLGDATRILAGVRTM